MPDFWPSCGHALLASTREGRLALTPEFLRAYLLRPEMRPEVTSCAAEQRLHAQLFEQPLTAIAAIAVRTIADADTRENYAHFLAFRDRLARAASIEEAYVGLFVDPPAHPIPPLFVDQLAQVILRRILASATDVQHLRAAELLFRVQRATVRDGAVMLADEEIVAMHAASGGLGDLGRLIVDAQTPIRHVTLDVLTEANAATYWNRDERHDLVLDLSFGRPGLDALARVLERWIAHLLGVDVSIQPVARIRDERWSWHVGLDPESNAIMNALYRGDEVNDERLARIIALMRLEFREPSVMRRDLAGRPVYLGLAHDAHERVRLKPQNLVVNLPLAARA